MNRNRDLRRRRRPRAERRRVLIVTEGKRTEPEYLQRLNQHLKACSIVVKPVGKDPARILEYADKLRRRDDFDSVWIVMDVDRHSGLEACLADARHMGVHTAISNPCFEVWLLWHHQDMRKSQTAEWLRRRLRDHHGHSDKSLPAGFPIENWVLAVDRARLDGGTSCGELGSNPGNGDALPLGRACRGQRQLWPRLIVQPAGQPSPARGDTARPSGG